MKVTSALLVVFCIIGCAVAQQDPFLSCPRTACVKGGEICGYITNTTYTGCRADSQCTVSSSGLNTLTGICQVPPGLGDSCTIGSGLSCETSTTCTRTGMSSGGAICVANAPNTEYLHPGEKCSYDVQCYFNSPFGSTDEYGLCRSGHCKSIKNGDYCSSNNKDQCNYEHSYCGIKNLCEKYISNGKACFYDDATSSGCGKDYREGCMPNGPDSGSDGNAGTCRSLHSQKENSYCRNVDDCKEGLYCKDIGSYNGICTKPYKSATLNVQCPNKTDTANNAGCNTTNNEACVCTEKGNLCLISSVHGAVAPLRHSGFHSVNYHYQECVRKSGCSGGDFSCIKDHCKSQTCALYKNQRKLPYTGLSCTYEGLCNSAFTLVATPILALVAIIVLVL